MMKKSALSLIAAMAVGTAAHAAVVIDSSFKGNIRIGFGGQTATASASLDASGSDKIVVVTATEHNFGGTSAPGVPIVQLDGVDFDLASTSYTGGSARVSILYLDNPGSGALTINSNGGSNGQAWHVYLLSGTDDGVGASNSAVGLSTSLTTTKDGSFVLGGVFSDGFNSGSVPSPTADAPQTTTLTSEGWNPGRVYGSVSSAHQDGGANGSNVTSAWTDGNGALIDSIAIAEFTAVIPEPSSLALLGLGGLLIARRRRG